MSTKGEDIKKDRIGFEKSNKALGYIYKEWYELISNFISEKEGINIELGCGASFIDQINKSIKKTDVFLNSNTDFKLNAMDIGCLLYTSPSPRDGCRSRMPSSA